MMRDDICKSAGQPDIDGTRLCLNKESLAGQKSFYCIGVHVCPDGKVMEE